MELLFSFGAFGIIALLGAVSPGPDFLVVSKNSLAHSRKIGIFTALGVALGVLVHVTYSVVGIGLVISNSIILFSIIKILGAVYLIWLGIKLLLEKTSASTSLTTGEISTHKAPLQALKEGFLTNVLNPKASIFFVSVFSQVVSPQLPMITQFLYGIEAAVIGGLWFAALVLMLTHPMIKNDIAKIQNRVLKVMGAALILLGIQVAFSQR